MVDGDAPQISVAAGVTVGLLASFVQSLGLTIQRKSHLQNEDLPASQRKQDHKRPLWIAGFAIFICANLLGTIFQIGALPIVVLGPLGAVSLLYNAFFARVILGDEFSVHLVLGTVFIAGGAVLIGIFGVVPEQTHTLDELVRLYSRPAFIIWITLLSVSLLVLLSTAHITEWAFERQCLRDDPALPTTPRQAKMWRRRSRKDSAPLLSHSHSAPAGTHGSPQRYGALDESTIAARGPHGSTPSVDGPPEMAANNLWKRPVAIDDAEAALPDEARSTLSDAAIERTRVILGVAYGSASGTLSGLCLLFAKTGIELLILTIVGQNQFGHYQAWLIILVLLVAAVLQLFYLNRALRLLGPHLVCPLAFCAYNLSSIVSGLIYYDQWDMLSGLQFGLVSLGTAILLAGVWIVSNRADHKGAKEKSLPLLAGAPFTNEPESDSDDSDTSSMQGPVEYIPRGLTIGLGAASPGFDIRPNHQHRRHTRTATLPAASITPLFDEPEHQRPLLYHTSSEADTGEATAELARRRKHARRVSISGGLFVGRLRGYDSISAPNSPVTASESPAPPPEDSPPRPWKRTSR